MNLLKWNLIIYYERLNFMEVDGSPIHCSGEEQFTNW